MFLLTLAGHLDLPPRGNHLERVTSISERVAQGFEAYEFPVQYVEIGKTWCELASSYAYV